MIHNDETLTAALSYCAEKPNSDGLSVYHRFPSAAAVSEHVSTALPYDRRASHKTGKDEREWNGGFTYEEAETALLAGWSAGVTPILELSNPLFDSISSLIERTDISFDVTGNFLDVARFSEGEPECWGTFHDNIHDGSGQRVLRVSYNITASAGVSAEVMQRRGMIITTLVNCLQQAGYRIELVLQLSISGYGGLGNMLFEVLLKAADQPLDLDKLAFQTSPAMFRRIGFAMMEHTPTWSRSRYGIGDMGSGYGYPVPTPAQYQGDIYLGEAHLNDDQWRTTKGATTWIINELKKQGVKLTGT